METKIDYAIQSLMSAQKELDINPQQVYNLLQEAETQIQEVKLRMIKIMDQGNQGELDLGDIENIKQI